MVASMPTVGSMAGHAGCSPGLRQVGVRKKKPTQLHQVRGSGRLGRHRRRVGRAGGVGGRTATPAATGGQGCAQQGCGKSVKIGPRGAVGVLNGHGPSPSNASACASVRRNVPAKYGANMEKWPDRISQECQKIVTQTGPQPRFYTGKQLLKSEQIAVRSVRVLGRFL